jgi:F0F1-type ATP synthase membrane subunit c/vacuolar-type H+-ATPase subunit K
MRILWVALLISVGLYAAMLGFGVVQPPRASEPPPFVIPFIGAAAMFAVMSFVLPRIIHRQAVSKTSLEVVAEPVPDAFAAGFRHAAPTQKVFVDPDVARRTAAACYQTPFILSLALSESVALLGFVLGFLGYGASVWAPFMVIAAVLMAVRFPTEQRIIAPFEAALGASIAGHGQEQGRSV